jgi:hypothetical protein
MRKELTTGQNIMLLVVYLLMLGTTFLRVYVMTVFYSWFAVPLGAPRIGWAVVYGLSLLIAFMGNGDKEYLLMKKDKSYDDELDKQSTKLAYGLGHIAVAWAFAAIWHYWVLN